MVKMKLIGVLDDQEHSVIVDDHDQNNGHYSVTLDGKNFLVDAQTMPSEIITALIDNYSYDLDIDDKDLSKDPLEGKMSVRVLGRVVRLEMLEERRKKMKDAQTSVLAHAGLAQVKSPMPGKVLRHLVKIGDEVQKGQGLIVIEAMKMENEISSPKAGIVKSIDCIINTPVESGALLLVIE